MVKAGGKRLAPFPDRILCFKEQSLLASCRQTLKKYLPWAFSIGPHTADIANIPAGTLIAETVVVCKSYGVEADISKSDFFCA
jgi:hypothetical protein